MVDQTSFAIVLHERVYTAPSAPEQYVEQETVSNGVCLFQVPLPLRGRDERAMVFSDNLSPFKSSLGKHRSSHVRPVFYHQITIPLFFFLFVLRSSTNAKRCSTFVSAPATIDQHGRNKNTERVKSTTDKQTHTHRHTHTHARATHRLVTYHIVLNKILVRLSYISRVSVWNCSSMLGLVNSSK